jgi:2'-5' RNA ligase
MRLFVAIDLPDAARDAIATEQQRIASALGGSNGSLKWVSAAHAHLTLVFLGTVDDAHVPALVETIGREVAQPPFEMVLEGVGVFPPRGAPRVLWIGVTAGAAGLVQLQRELAARVAAFGLPLEDRPFHPHLTLARWKASRPADRERALKAARPGPIARARIERATLYQSRLSPAGPTYTPLAHANLTRRT